MKTLIFILIGFFLTLSVNGQWYYNQHNVSNINELTKPQLELAMEHAEDLITTGKTLTFLGVGIAILGNVIVRSGNADDLEQELNKAMTGVILSYAGGITAGTGIGVWIGGASKKKDIEVALVKFKGNTGMITPGLSIKFNF